MAGGSPFQHKVARSAHPAYPARTPVPDNLVQLSTSWPAYAPLEFTHKVVHENDCSKKAGGWADPIEVSQLSASDWDARPSQMGKISFDVDGRPLNPCGRTGMVGRGLLGRWGPNYTADPLVTRWHPENPRRLQMVTIRRKDTGDWAIPGGMVDAGEAVSVTVRREFVEEAGNVPKGEKALFQRLTDELFANGKCARRVRPDRARGVQAGGLGAALRRRGCCVGWGCGGAHGCHAR